MGTNHDILMGRCLDLAKTAAGRTSPNPMVGAVIVQGGEIVGEGFHPGAGQPHAEVFALKQAGEKAQGGCVYVNLEPCNHYGRTPPCTEALIAAKVAQVVVGMIDPDPRVSGSGVARLREAGIEVIVGVEEEACRLLNEAFIHRILRGQPFGILKYAMTVDGKIATDTGHSAWVTGSQSRHYVHQLRGASDAVIIGGNTLRRDNPLLTTHGVTDHNPLRVVLSRTLDLPSEANLWQVNTAPTLVFTQTSSNISLQEHLKDLGVEVVALDILTPKEVMEHLYHRGLCSVFWECGGTLAARAIAAGAVQKVIAFIAPKIIGGEMAPTPVGDLGLVKMSDALKLQRVKTEQIDDDFVIEGYLE